MTPQPLRALREIAFAGPAMLNVKTIQWRSIRVGLTKVFVLFLALVILLGFFSVEELGAVNKVSAEIRDRWLQSTRVLGDLNNYTSDARAAEASRLLARDAAQGAAVDRQIGDLNRAIAHSDRDYRRIFHDGGEATLYRRFAAAWQAYGVVANRVLALSRRGATQAADDLYMSGSLRAYTAASDALGVLTNRTVARAAAVNNRALATYDTARTLILLVLAAAGVGLVVAVNYIGRHITGPILSLAAAMRSLAANNMGAEVEGSDREDEIGEMARAVEVFRGNAIELAHSQQGLVQQAIMLEERLEAEQALTDLQRNFVSMASHEFRTPLTIIDGHAQRLISTAERSSPDDVAERAGRIRKTVRQMTLLIEHLMSTSKLLDGKAGLYFHPTQIDISDLISDVVRIHREVSPNAQIIESNRSGVTICGDYNLLYQAVGNLLANAIKYSPDGGTIRVGLDVYASQVEVVIEDEGIGVPVPDLDRVFDRYHRASNAHGIVGTGIGLHLVKMVAGLHGGAVAVQNRNERGARFTVRLPISSPAS
jgi:signal transduction histidine kinase